MNFPFGSKTKELIYIILQKKPDAEARIRGNGEYSSISGTVSLYGARGGVLVKADLSGLPKSQPPCADKVLGFHIHSGGSCTGNSTDPFADAGTHFNPGDCPHPSHAGDMPPLFADRDGRAFLIFFTDRFQIQDVIGRAVIVHSDADDFHTQPSGNSGSKIACGVIRAS